MPEASKEASRPLEHRAGFVAIAGRPNAGKSTLLNALVGEKVGITAPQAQTTRTTAQGILTLPGAQIIFVDTPGIHESDTLFNKRMMGAVRGALEQRDLAVFVADATKPVTEDDARAVSALARSGKAILVLNKIDRVEDKRALLPVIEQYQQLFPFEEVIPVSARTGNGLDQLKQIITSHLPPGPALLPEDTYTDQPVRFLAAEIIRERILRATREEVPHAVAVLIDTWEETPKMTRIAATIYVERDGQKVILIGSKGQMLKRIGTESREEIERLLDRKVFLSLFVKVKPRWREDPEFLDAMDWRAMLGKEDAEP